jgi:hypothetical protein
LGEGDELPNCFLERRRLGCHLPCAIRLRTQRSDHMAVGAWSSSTFRRCFRGYGEGDADRALGAAAQRAVREAAMGGRVSIVAG